MTTDLRFAEAGLPAHATTGDAQGTLQRFGSVATQGAILAAVVALLVAMSWLAVRSVSPADCARYGSCSVAALMQTGTPE